MRSRNPRLSIPQRRAILAWIRAADEDATVPVDADRLAAAERARDFRHLVPERGKPLAHHGRHSPLYLDLAHVWADPRKLERLLDAHSVFQRVGEEPGLAH